ncbi:hypothetical protein C1T17_13865 [Sphingobium sp. SCG-1]|uniref:DUF3489 domain-containing protein n=1 Tax=Sphingobium sp. SCG-1 TaxID=2072936 RepID=UPI000CD69CC5|nr:DUF3489 domain-containing protein [Sphingobium sp. SCG-1]AUW59019.1 hypothetical protein C1T17_13865 [Sphingobium sp. SCG-1]
MTGITRLTDIQLILLATAARRDNGSLLPPPETLGEGPARIRKAVEALIRRGLAAEAELAPGADAWRTEGDRALGVVITEAGRAAIAMDTADDGSDSPAVTSAQVNGAAPAAEVVAPPAPPEVPAPEVPLPAKPAPARTKTSDVLELLRRESGATLDELTAVTGWLPHTTRAALTGLRKKGHAIVRGKRDEVSCYTLDAEVAA